MLTEIDLIKRAGRADSTVVVLPSEATRAHLTSTRDTSVLLSNVDPTTFAPFATTDDAALHGFRRFVAEDELLQNDLTSIRAFDGLLCRG